MMFVYYGHVHVYSPRAGADKPLGTNFFHKHNNSVYLLISCKFCPSNHILTIFPIQMHWRPMLTLPRNSSRSSQGHDLHKFCRTPLLDASCQVSKSKAFLFWSRRVLKVFAIYRHGGHLGHVTWTIYINFRSPFLRMLHMKFGFDCPSGFTGEDV